MTIRTKKTNLTKIKIASIIIAELPYVLYLQKIVVFWKDTVCKYFVMLYTHVVIWSVHPIINACETISYSCLYSILLLGYLRGRSVLQQIINHKM